MASELVIGFDISSAINLLPSHLCGVVRTRLGRPFA